MLVINRFWILSKTFSACTGHLPLNLPLPSLWKQMQINNQTLDGCQGILRRGEERTVGASVVKDNIRKLTVSTNLGSEVLKD